MIAAAGNRIFVLAESPSERTSSGSVITALAVSDHRTFVGTPGGVHLSQDGARTFVDWSEGLHEACRIVALGALDDGVYAITLGGEVWRRAVTPSE